MNCVWAGWGIIENFHEGWYYPTLGMNLGLMLTQYLSPMLIFIGLTLLGIRKPRIAALFHVLIAGLATWFFRTGSIAATSLIITPLLGLGVLYWFGKVKQTTLATWVAVGLPIATLVLLGISPAVRVAQRLDDGSLEAQLIVGNGTALIWAPDGPGWPDTGSDWHQAVESCRQLSEDGQTLTGKDQDIWRLPSVEEAVRSLTRAGKNSGGVWDPDPAEASYQVRPDKESPLWKVHSPVIYWWTASEVDQDRAYIIVYDGKVWPRSKDFGPDYLGFRCVKRP
ncbi:MAG: hypothetical protein P8Y37_09560 [Anaerolineales bacterium]